MGLKENIKSKRIERKMTLEDLAKSVGVSRQTIQRYESGVIGNIPSDKIELIARALDTSPAYLMGWEKVDSRFSGKEASSEEYNKLKKNVEKHHTNSALSNLTAKQIELFTGSREIMKVAEDIMNKRQLEEFNRRLKETLPDKLNPIPTTLAAHFDGDEYTEDELDEIRQFAEFVKNKRAK